MDMTLHWFIALALYAAVLIIAPGHNNIMLANSGMIYGFKEKFPQILGVSLGAPLILFVVASGGNVLLKYEIFRNGLRIICLLYLFWLAYKIAIAKSPEMQEASKPFTFLHVVALQWVNPKVWSQYIIGVGIFININHHYVLQILSMAIIFTIIAIPSACIWTLFGKIIAKYLRHPSHYRIFNVVMALLLLGTVLPVIIDNFS